MPQKSMNAFGVEFDALGIRAAKMSDAEVNSF
jgi:hypothetical protein